MREWEIFFGFSPFRWGGWHRDSFFRKAKRMDSKEIVNVTTHRLAVGLFSISLNIFDASAIPRPNP